VASAASESPCPREDRAKRIDGAPQRDAARARPDAGRLGAPPGRRPPGPRRRTTDPRGRLPLHHRLQERGQAMITLWLYRKLRARRAAGHNEHAATRPDKVSSGERNALAVVAGMAAHQFRYDLRAFFRNRQSRFFTLAL